MLKKLAAVLALVMVTGLAPTACKKKSKKKNNPPAGQTDEERQRLEAEQRQREEQERRNREARQRGQNPQGNNQPGAQQNNQLGIRILLEGRDASQPIRVNSQQIGLRLQIQGGQAIQNYMIGLTEAPNDISITNMAGSPALIGLLPFNNFDPHRVTVLVRDRQRCTSQNGGAQCNLRVDGRGRFAGQVQANQAYDAVVTFTIQRVNDGSGINANQNNFIGQNGFGQNGFNQNGFNQGGFGGQNGYYDANGNWINGGAGFNGYYGNGGYYNGGHYCGGNGLVSNVYNGVAGLWNFVFGGNGGGCGCGGNCNAGSPYYR